MTIDGNTIVWASAGVVAIAIIAGAVYKFARRETNADVGADKVKLLEQRVDAQSVALGALDKRVALLERDHANHHENDERAFAALQASIDSLRASIEKMSHDLLDVLVALKVKDRPRDPRES